MNLSVSHTPRTTQVLKLLWMVLSYAVPAHAELNYLDLKGIDNLVDHPGASPIYGYMALQNSLENHRFFGNYGHEKKEFPCYNGTPNIKKALQDQNDCPQDYTTMWLQRLFPSQSGSFGANNIDSDPIARQLTPEIIGRILGRIAVDRDHDPTHRDPNLEQDLLHILYQGMNPVSYGHWNATLTKEEAKLSSTLKRLQPPTKDGCVLPKSQVSSELVKLQKNFADVQAHLGRIARYAPLVSAQDTNKGKLADFQLLAHTLVGALNESRPTAPGTPSLYPAYLPEQTLLAFLIKKSKSKEDLVRFIKGLKEGDSPTHHSILKDPDFLTNEHKKTAFLLDHWSPADYHPEAVEQNLDAAAQNFIHHPEKLLFYMMRERTSKKPIPPVIGMGSTKHESLEQTHYKTYTDCGETSLRNFFNVIFYDKGTQKFNSEIMSELKTKTPSLNFRPELQRFYTAHSDPISSTSQEVRDEWTACVSQHPGVTYKKPASQPVCEIQVGVDNLMKVMDHLLFKESPQLVTKATRSEKLDYLCEILSQGDKKLTWSLEGAKNEAESKGQLNEKDSNVKIRFSINGVSAFSWEILNGHADLRDLTSSIDSWKSKIGKKLLNTKDPKALHQMPWFASSGIVNAIVATARKEGSKEPSEIVSLLYSLPFKNDLDLLMAYRLAYASDRLKTAPLNSLIKRIRAKWPETPSLEILRGIHRAMADADYPLGIPLPHTLNHPESSYTRVDSSEIAEKFGGTTAQKMGRSWMRQIYGHPLVIGDTFLNDETGWPSFDFNFEQAKQACLDLNPETKKPSVERQFNERSALLIAARKKDPNNPDLVTIHQKHAIEGCYLMSLDEWEVVMADMGYQKNKADHEQQFIPQFLPHLAGAFWTSSEEVSWSDWGFLVEGTTGATFGTPSGIQYSLRCACRSP